MYDIIKLWTLENIKPLMIEILWFHLDVWNMTLYDHISVIICSIKWSIFLSLLPILAVSDMPHFKAIIENWKKERNTKLSLSDQPMVLWEIWVSLTKNSKF